MGANRDYNLGYIIVITLVAALGGLLFGYDTAVISGAEKGLQAFFLGATDFNYTRVLHGITAASALIGCVIGGSISGIFANKFGRRNSLRFASVLFFLSALGSFFPEFLFFKPGEASMNLLVAFNLYRILGGIGVGLASAIVPMYIAEIAPSNIRGTLVSCNQFAIIFGMLVVYFVNFLILGDHTNPIFTTNEAGLLAVDPASDAWTISRGWRYMFISEAYVAGVFGVLLFLVPRTPRYLVLIGEEEQALKVLTKVNGARMAKEILADIVATSKEKTEKIFSYGITVVIIGILLSVFQQAIGINAVLYYAPRIFESAGADGMLSTVIMGISNIIFTVVAILTVDKLGRKPLLIIGSIGMAAGAFAVMVCGGAGLIDPTAQAPAEGATMGILGFLPVVSVMVYSAFFMMSWGPICWVLISEIFPNTIRGKAVAIAVAFQWIFNYLVSSTFPPLFDFSPMLSYGLYGTMCVLAAIFVWRWVPETKGKTLEEMSKLWRKS
jgi:SP family xylose:H+ symportor-like MFS transporter